MKQSLTPATDDCDCTVVISSLLHVSTQNIITSQTLMWTQCGPKFCLALFCCCCVNRLIVSLEAFLEEQLAYQDAKYPREVSDLSGWQPDETQIPLWTYCCTPHCCEPAERPPPTTESEVRRELIRCVCKCQRFSSSCQETYFFNFSSCKRFTDSRTRLEA